MPYHEPGQERPGIGSTNWGRILSNSVEVLSSVPVIEDRFVHISRTFGDNTSPADLLAALAQDQCSHPISARESRS